MKKKNTPILLERFRSILNSINQDIILKEKVSELGFSKQKINEMLILYREIQSGLLKERDNSYETRNLIEQFVFVRQSIQYFFEQALVISERSFNDKLKENCNLPLLEAIPNSFIEWKEVVRDFYSFLLHNCSALAIITKEGISSEKILKQIFELGKLEKLWTKNRNVIEYSYEHEIKLMKFRMRYNELKVVVDKVVEEEPFLMKKIAPQLIN